MEITEDMIERGARALLASANPSNPTPWESLVSHEHWLRRSETILRAALEGVEPKTTSEDLKDSRRRPHGLLAKIADEISGYEGFSMPDEEPGHIHLEFYEPLKDWRELLGHVRDLESELAATKMANTAVLVLLFNLVSEFNAHVSEAISMLSLSVGEIIQDAPEPPAETATSGAFCVACLSVHELPIAAGLGGVCPQGRTPINLSGGSS